LAWLSLWLIRELWHFVLWAAASCRYPGLFFRHASLGHGATVLFFYWLHAFAHFRASGPLPPRVASRAFMGTGALVGCGLLFTAAFYFINAGSTRVGPSDCTGFGGLGPLLFLTQALSLVFERNKKAGKATACVGLAHGIVIAARKYARDGRFYGDSQAEGRQVLAVLVSVLSVVVYAIVSANGGEWSRTFR
jgi:hypothetical protein